MVLTHDSCLSLGMWPQLYHLRELSLSNYNRNNNDVIICWEFTMSRLFDKNSRWLPEIPENHPQLKLHGHTATETRPEWQVQACPDPAPVRRRGEGSGEGCLSLIQSHSPPAPGIRLPHLSFIFIFPWKASEHLPKFKSLTPKVKTKWGKLENDKISSK